MWKINFEKKSGTTQECNNSLEGREISLPVLLSPFNGRYHFSGTDCHDIFSAILRWCVVNIYHVRFSRLFLQTVDLGPVPPAVLNLSDGGHVEDLGLLALLKKRLRKIVVVDGTSRGQSQPVSLELQRSLELARKKLRCSFSAMDGRDVAEDLRCKLDEMPDNYKPRFYKFRVEYFERKPNGLSDEKVGEGDVLLILPRHPDQGKSRVISQWTPP